MRIDQPQWHDGSWSVFAQPGEFYGNTADVLIGFVSPRGRLEVVKRRFRGDQLRSARLRLDDARRTLVSGGHIRDRGLERAIEEEAQTGSFIVELDSGEERRFHSLAPEAGRRTTAQRIDRPSAREWAEEALQSGRATHADLFRHTMTDEPERSKIFVPHILPARGDHPRLVVGEAEQLPIHSWSMRDGSGFLRGTRPREVQRAYEAKKHAMNLVTERELSRGSPWNLPGVGEWRPFASEIADAWDVALDAFLEARLPLQVVFARDNARYWRDEAEKSATATRDLRRRR